LCHGSDFIHIPLASGLARHFRQGKDGPEESGEDALEENNCIEQAAVAVNHWPDLRRELNHWVEMNAIPVTLNLSPRQWLIDDIGREGSVGNPAMLDTFYDVVIDGMWDHAPLNRRKADRGRGISNSSRASGWEQHGELDVSHFRNSGTSTYPLAWGFLNGTGS